MDEFEHLTARAAGGRQVHAAGTLFDMSIAAPPRHRGRHGQEPPQEHLPKAGDSVAVVPCFARFLNLDPLIPSRRRVPLRDRARRCHDRRSAASIPKVTCTGSRPPFDSLLFPTAPGARVVQFGHSVPDPPGGEDANAQKLRCKGPLAGRSRSLRPSMDGLLRLAAYRLHHHGARRRRLRLERGRREVHRRDRRPVVRQRRVRPAGADRRRDQAARHAAAVLVLHRHR